VNRSSASATALRYQASRLPDLSPATQEDRLTLGAEGEQHPDLSAVGYGGLTSFMLS
jgi:hypothetical protein